MDYNKTIASLRELARDLLRLKMINENKALRHNLEKSWKQAGDNLAVANYELSALDPLHPNYAKIKEAKEKEVEKLSDSLNYWDEELTKTDMAVSDIENGGTKVGIDELNCEADKLIRNYITQKARDLE